MGIYEKQEALKGDSVFGKSANFLLGGYDICILLNLFVCILYQIITYYFLILSFSISLITFFLTFPVTVIGKLSTTRTYFGILNLDILPAQ